MAKSTRAAPRKRSQPRSAHVHVGAAPCSQPLLHGVDSGAPIFVNPTPFIIESREQGWGSYLDGFLERNRVAFDALCLEPRIVAGRGGVRLELSPGLRAGAVPLRSAVTGKVAGGIVISPRFGWPGVGRVLSATGWGSAPELIDLPLVPGSGREIPPWVLAGPVLQRLSDLLSHLRPGYRECCEVRTHPRGQIQWTAYLNHSFPKGRWHHLPSKFSELGTDSRLREAIRWTLERLYGDLSACGGNDATGRSLVRTLVLLLEQVMDVQPRRPTRAELEHSFSNGTLQSGALREGVRAMGWIVDERGLGGGRSSDGLAWTLPLEQLWERYVERIVRDEAARSGGRVRVGHAGETTVPLAWNTRSHRALGHLVPDFVIYRADSVEIVDAKYKSHFADLDESHWMDFTEKAKDSFRSDLHQVLAYAAVLGDRQIVTSTLLYPVRRELFNDLVIRRQDKVTAHISVGTRSLQLSMRAIPFGLGTLP
jgi:hypothetical protein